MESVIEFDDNSGAEGKHIAQQHAAGSETEFNVETDIHEASVTGGVRSRRRRRWLGRCLRGRGGVQARLEFGCEGRAYLNFDGEGSTSFGFVPGFEADDGVRGPGGSGRGGEMELNFAAGGRGEGGGGQAGNLAQEFFQGLFVLRSDVFGAGVFSSGGLSFAEELLSEARAGSGRQPQGHLAMD